MKLILKVVVLIIVLELLFSLIVFWKHEQTVQVLPKVIATTPITPIVTPHKAITATKKAIVRKYAPPTEKIALVAEKYNVSRVTMAKIIACESGNNPRAVGDGNRSFGLVQIFLPAHPNITKEQALDPDFAIDFLGKKLSEGEGHIWTCYRKNAKIESST